MKKPSKRLLDLVKIGTITLIKIDYKQTGTDTADTFIQIVGSNGKSHGLLDIYKDYLNLDFSYNSIATVKPWYIEEVRKWWAFEKENNVELAEYERLKKKFGGDNK